MKTTQLLPLAMGLLPALSNAQANWGWTIDNVPDAGLTDITFPISVTGSDHEKHYYYAMQYPFLGVDGIGYTGLQPQADADNGTAQIRGVFSTFISGSTTDDDQCSEGADGGPGISCGLVFEGDYSATYNLVIKNTGGTTWTGTAVNKKTSEQLHLGTYTLPSSAKGIKGGHMGFVEDYLGVDQCSEMIKGGTVVGKPFSDSTTNAKGGIDEPNASGTCSGQKANWSAKNGTDGWTMTLGF